MLNEAVLAEPVHDQSAPSKDEGLPSLIVNLSQRGAAILQPKNNFLPRGEFNIMIVSPTMSDCIETRLHAEMRWVKQNYSRNYRKVGIEFTDVSSVCENRLQLFINWMIASDYPRIPCNISAG